MYLELFMFYTPFINLGEYVTLTFAFIQMQSSHQRERVMHVTVKH